MFSGCWLVGLLWWSLLLYHYQNRKKIKKNQETQKLFPFQFPFQRNRNGFFLSSVASSKSPNRFWVWIDINFFNLRASKGGWAVKEGNTKQQSARRELKSAKKKLMFIFFWKNSNWRWIITTYKRCMSGWFVGWFVGLNFQRFHVI